MSDESDFARFDEVPGFHLIDYKRVGLPVYQVQINVLAEERRELHLVGEYCLRLLQAGVNRLEDIVRLLGVSPHIVRVELADLFRLNAVLAMDNDLSITEYGKEMLEPYGDMVCKEATWYVPFDGILRRPYPWRAEQLRTGRQLADLGQHLEISPIGERPSVRDFDINAVSQVLSQLRFGGKDMDRLVSIRSVRKSPLRFVSATALAYESKAGGDDNVRVMFLIDGRPSHVHDEAFVNGNGLRRPMCRALGAKRESEAQLRATARRRLVRSRSEISSARSLTGKLSLLGSEESTPDLRDLPIYLVRSRWTESFSSATARLIVTTRAVSETYLLEILPQLKQLLMRDVRLCLGIASDALKASEDGKAPGAIAILQALENDHAGFTLGELDQPTATHLIIDNRVLLIGDYDWLMPEGATVRQFRHSWMLETDNRAIIEKEADRVLGELRLRTTK